MLIGLGKEYNSHAVISIASYIPYQLSRMHPSLIAWVEENDVEENVENPALHLMIIK